MNGLSISRLGSGNVFVHRIHQFQNTFVFGSVEVGAGAFQRLQPRAANDRRILAGEALLRQQFTQFQFYQFQQFRDRPSYPLC